ncbi:DUF4240 domain-containing protein [Actinoplanes sp. NPDC026670]|uniref:DUF4240 domain-containing protein n=1 Tax=Actinoplanes sp. NPDC026670 TaxID=3154700 RepID=UPI0033D4916F
MDIDEFWQLIEHSGGERPGDQDAREEWLIAALTRLDPVHIEDFEIRLQELRDRIDNAAVWGAAEVVYDGASDDTFWYFQCWLIGQGRERFELVEADPDALATLPGIRRLAGRRYRDWADDEWPDWESLDYVAGKAHPGDLEEALAARGFTSRCDPLPPDWESMPPYPRLRGLFPHSRE